jgi:release factor glutamine methyltransferase
MATNSTEAVGATEAWTVERVLGFASDDFKSRGLDTPRLDAELLLCHVLGLDRVKLILECKRPLRSDELGRYRELIKRRRAREPIAYILGGREFYGHWFHVDSRVLIPRPDTETLVDVALVRTRDRSMFGDALDLCTGSGCVAIAFAKRRPTWRVSGTDLSEGAVQLARENALRLGAVLGVRFVAGDLSQAFGPDERFDLVTANPPYVPSADVDALEAGIRDYEPRLALDGGQDGMAVVRRIVEESRSRLRPGGVLALEVHYDQAVRVSEILQRAGFVDVERTKDYGGHERVVSARFAQGPV